MKVDRINLDGELGVVNSARVSFGVWKNELDDKDRKLIEYLRKHKHKSPFFHPQVCFKSKLSVEELFWKFCFNKLDLQGLECETFIENKEYKTYGRLSLALYNKYCIREFDIIDNNTFNEAFLLSYLCDEEVDKIINYNKNLLHRLARLPYLSFRIKAPIFVVRQLEKHQVGMAKNERSGRYVKFECEFYTPEKWRKQSPSNKQGSLQDEFVEEKPFVDFNYSGYEFKSQDIERIVKGWYNANVLDGEVCPEQGRQKLTLDLFTEFVWTGSLQDYARICSLRLKKNVQKETRDCVEMIYRLCKAEYPQTFDTLIEMENRENF